ncbi:hypothetical protein O6P43_026915 [Quillaja saponaria]|uniref:Uncharacterized protein n=1 Tax=Quillaja saponaria TaxID=32244 RepID=A0AAD7L3G3_QUISA|nr:hypothetical protein O6P43_026915 [Quillaja saponaria]
MNHGRGRHARGRSSTTRWSPRSSDQVEHPQSPVEEDGWSATASSSFVAKDGTKSSWQTLTGSAYKVF